MLWLRCFNLVALSCFVYVIQAQQMYVIMAQYYIYNDATEYTQACTCLLSF